MSFKFQARYVLLTYAQCGSLDPWAVSDHLSSLGAECIVGRENHADGGTHLHAFVDFGKRFSTRNTKVFDVEGFHPNIEPSKGRPWGGYDYAIKDGDVVAGGLERPPERGGGEGVSSATAKWAEIVAQPTREQFWTALEELDPCAMVRSFPSCRAFADWRYRVDREAYTTPRGITFRADLVEGLQEWVDGNLGRHHEGGE